MDIAAAKMPNTAGSITRTVSSYAVDKRSECLSLAATGISVGMAALPLPLSCRVLTGASRGSEKRRVSFVERDFPVSWPLDGFK